MALNKKYQSQESAIASYSYTDIAEGTGVTVFYGGESQNATTSGSWISVNPMYSNSITSIRQTDSTTFEEIISKDFDAIFNAPRTVKGKARASITLGYTCQNVDESGQCYAVITLKHVDSDANETTIATVTSETFSQSGTLAVNTASSVIRNVELDATAGQHFKSGETLRVNVKIWAKRVSGNAQVYGFGHDPKDRNDDGVAAGGKIIEDTDTTTFIVHIPFRLDNI